ncbi:MAG: serine/threonine protein kinase, partial [Planctomycetota bacterium]
AFKIITPDDVHEADTVWDFDMMKELRVSQHNMAACSVTSFGDILFVNTSNGVDESHLNIPSPDAPSFIAMNKHTGELYWTDASPGRNILHGQWSSPAVGVLGGVPQVIFAGGDGWVYSFRADKGVNGKPVLLWKFDANPKESKWILGGRGTRNNLIATPVIYDGLVYIAVGQDPEHGEGEGHLWCIDPTKRGDVSPQLAMKIEGDRRVPLPPRRIQAVIPEQGEVAVDNPNSAVVWHYSRYDQNGDGEFDFEEELHRTVSTVAIKNDLLFLPDFSGLFHCVDAKTGKVHWTYDMLAAAWGSPLIVEDHVYIGDEDGDISVFRLSADPKVAMKDFDGTLEPINIDEEGYPPNMGNAVYSTPIVANNVLYISNKDRLFAIAPSQ